MGKPLKSINYVVAGAVLGFVLGSAAGIIAMHESLYTGEEIIPGAVIWSLLGGLFGNVIARFSISR